MTIKQTRWYRSKLDWWLVPLLCLPPLAAIGVCINAALARSTSDLLVGAVVAVFVAGLYLGIIFPLRYGVDDTHLIVTHGVCRQRIALAEILNVYPTRNPLSSPALSLDRLHVQFGQGFFKGVMISPAERDHFLGDLAQKAGLKREGDRLYRN
ncbi:hypothetical protein FJY94_07260 [Candidatus Kaiserbacteria bacterium]|nr:hypothetical protein [Candidatus Kaiserbacteria bacterium]